MVMVNS